MKAPMFTRSMSPPAFAMRFPCVSMAPLGTPVVPEVKQMSARSLGDGGMWARGCSLPRLITSSKRRILHVLRAPCGTPGKYCPFFAPYTACVQRALQGIQSWAPEVDAKHLDHRLAGWGQCCQLHAAPPVRGPLLLRHIHLVHVRLALASYSGLK